MDFNEFNYRMGSSYKGSFTDHNSGEYIPVNDLIGQIIDRTSKNYLRDEISHSQQENVLEKLTDFSRALLSTVPEAPFNLAGEILGPFLDIFFNDSNSEIVEEITQAIAGNTVLIEYAKAKSVCEYYHFDFINSNFKKSKLDDLNNNIAKLSDVFNIMQLEIKVNQFWAALPTMVAVVNLQNCMYQDLIALSESDIKNERIDSYKNRLTSHIDFIDVNTLLGPLKVITNKYGWIEVSTYISESRLTLMSQTATFIGSPSNLNRILTDVNDIRRRAMYRERPYVAEAQKKWLEIIANLNS